MNRSEKQMLQLLRMALWQHTDDSGMLTADTDWNTIRQLSEQQTVWGLVASAISRWVDATGTHLDESFLQACLRAQFNTVRDNDRVNGVLADVLQFLRGSDIAPVLIKGQGVARYYAHPQLRNPGDIDLFVDDKAQQAADLLRPHADPDSYSDEHPKHLQFAMTGIEVEIHKYVINRDTTTTSKVLEQWATEELQADKCQHIEHRRSHRHCAFAYVRCRLHILSSLAPSDEWGCGTAATLRLGDAAASLPCRHRSCAVRGAAATGKALAGLATPWQGAHRTPRTAQTGISAVPLVSSPRLSVHHQTTAS